MTESNTTKILKNAILLERRGMAFYRKVAEQSTNSDVREFFEMMADEEANHIEILSEQFKEFHASGNFLPGRFDDKHASSLDSKILNKPMMERISAAAFEAAAISAAVAMEKRAVDLYAQRARETSDANEQALYQWLSEWETSHLRFLTELDKQLTETIWYDNNFWPF